MLWVGLYRMRVEEVLTRPRPEHEDRASSADFQSVGSVTIGIARLDGCLRACHERAMSKGRYTQAGGSILAISIIAGTVAGVIVRQPSIGFLVGAAAGVLLAVLFWRLDQRG